MRTLDLSKIDPARDPYWRGRLGYYAAAAAVVARRPEGRVLELGAYSTPLVPDADLMDREDPFGLDRLVYLHDARITPWPVPTARYDGFVALQVFEHLDGCQPAAWAEVERITTTWALLSIPYRWPAGRSPGHDGLDDETLRKWTGRAPASRRLVVDPGAKYGRLLALYDLTDTGVSWTI